MLQKDHDALFRIHIYLMRIQLKLFLYLMADPDLPVHLFFNFPLDPGSWLLTKIMH